LIRLPILSRCWSPASFFSPARAGAAAKPSSDRTKKQRRRPSDISLKIFVDSAMVMLVLRRLMARQRDRQRRRRQIRARCKETAASPSLCYVWLCIMPPYDLLLDLKRPGACFLLLLYSCLGSAVL
jgi:hypothetical protein